MDINCERFSTNLHTIGEIGADPAGGITRPAYTPQYLQARELLQAKLAAAGFAVRLDAVGNLFARRAGTDPTRPAILIGSHLDTVVNGGLLDGCLGIVAALECLETLNDRGIATRHPVELAAFAAEEGGPLGGTFGSRAMVGCSFPETEVFAEALSQCGLTREDIAGSRRDMGEVACFLELHIEQGGILAHENKKIGIVEGIVGITRHAITARGEANHAGTTPMDLRRDALTGMAKLLVEIDRIAARTGPPFVATVGTLEVSPGHVSVVPGEARAVLEMRDLDQGRIDRAAEEIFAFGETIRGVTFSHTPLVSKPPVTTDAGFNDLMEGLCREQGLPYRRMPSGAGHDAKEIAFHVPASMIFVPSTGGISHSPKEYTSPEDLAAGVRFLLDVILRADKTLP